MADRDAQRAQRVAQLFADQDAQAASTAPRPPGWGSATQRELAHQAAEAFRACLATEEAREP
jgi:hypothetical protein